MSKIYTLKPKCFLFIYLLSQITLDSLKTSNIKFLLLSKEIRGPLKSPLINNYNPFTPNFYKIKMPI
jgi:hypothetical protein